MNINIAICDDERTEIEYLSMLVAKWAKTNNISAVVLTFESAESFLFHYAEDKSFNMLLLDIQMKNMDGVELAKLIRKDNEIVQIVFITGFPDFIAEGYEVSALHYLMKPVNEQKLFEVLDKARKNLNRTERAILLAVDGESVRVPVCEIIYAESFAHTVVITTTKEELEAKLSISELEKLVDEGCIRCHRSYVVGLKFIKRITKTEVLLDNGTAIPLSRRSYNEVNQAFIEYFKGVLGWNI